MADEIRKLADRVSGSTKEVRALIEDVRRRYTEPRMYQYRLVADSPPLKAGEVATIGYTDRRGLLSRFRPIEANIKLENGEYKSPLWKFFTDAEKEALGKTE